MDETSTSSSSSDLLVTSKVILSEETSKGKLRYFCAVCQRSLESEITRDEHVRGKRHVANLEVWMNGSDRDEYNTESKCFNRKNKGGCKDLKNERSLSLQERLKQPLKQPVLGLQHVLECWSALKSNPVYECRLCESRHEHTKIIAHLNSHQHLRKCLYDCNKDFRNSGLDISQVYIEAKRLEGLQESPLSVEVSRDESVYKSIVRLIRDSEANLKQDLKRGLKSKTTDEETTQNASKKAKIATCSKYEETEYYEQAGLRKVYPYYYSFSTHTKGRWVGARLAEVFATEFSAHSKEHFDDCIKAGRLTVNGNVVNGDYCLKHNDLVANVVHRHELGVSNTPITLLHKDEDIVVINKPSSIPVHPCGRYRYNSVLYILAKDHGLSNLCTIHRLDRLTSGVLMIARNRAKAREMEQLIRNRLVTKHYLCRVNGLFPKDPVVCREPIKVLSHKVGVCHTASDGKPSVTHFKLLHHNNNQSVVQCRPETGRMHQIRVHLQYLGFPILNDPLYNSPVFGTERGKGGCTGKSEDQLVVDLITFHGNYQVNDDQNANNSPTVKASQVVNSEVVSDNHDSSNVPHVYNTDELRRFEKSTGSPQSALPPFDSSKMTFEATCDECRRDTRDPSPNELFMCLHAWKYEGPDWCFQTEMPDWAHPNWRLPSLCSNHPITSDTNSCE